jgi:hypothetical protein
VGKAAFLERWNAGEQIDALVGRDRKDLGGAASGAIGDETGVDLAARQVSDDRR